MFSFGQQVKALPGKPFTTLIMSGGQPDHKYTEFMDFMRWRTKMSRVRLFGASLVGKQAL